MGNAFVSLNARVAQSLSDDELERAVHSWTRPSSANLQGRSAALKVLSAEVSRRGLMVRPESKD